MTGAIGKPAERRHGPLLVLALRLGAWIGLGLLRLLGASWRFRVVGGERRLEELEGGSQPALLCYWHNRAVGVGYFLWRRLLRAGFPMAAMASQSRDGQLAAEVLDRVGFRVVRGSATRGGRQGLRRLYREISRQGSSAMLIPDGPHGPAYRAKMGVVVLAQMTNAPLLPLSFAVDRCWRIGSWDRLIVPKPFARLSLAVGEPIQVPRGADGEELEAHRLRLEESLSTLGEQLVGKQGDCERSGVSTGSA